MPVADDSAVMADTARPGALSCATGSADPAALSDRLLLTLARVGRQLRRQNPPGLSVALYSALATTADRGELAEAERVPASAATRIADRLEEAGGVERRPNPRDRRGVIVSITAAGRQLVRERRERGNAWLSVRLAGLTAAERQTLADALCLLDTAVARDDGSPAAPGAVTGTEEERR